MYELIASPNSRSIRITWMLEELGQEYKFTSCKPHSPEVLAVNPSGKAPVLRDGDVVIQDSAAIITYLADQHPDMGLSFPSGTAERGLMDSLVQFAQTDLESPIWFFTRTAWLLPEDKKVPEANDLCKEDFAKAIMALEQRIGDKEFAMGDIFTVPDILFGHIYRWSKRVEFDVPSDSVKAYMERIIARPALGLALKREKAESEV
jgi:glutathione S-transferase